MVNYKKEILELRAQGLSYNAIQAIIKCSKGTISKYCSNDNTANQTVAKFNDDQIKLINEYLKIHTVKDTAIYFNTTTKTIRKYCGLRDKKNIKTKDDIIQYRRNYQKIRRIKKKQKCVDYKGGKCIVCGYNRCLKALSFHHINPEEKEFTIAQNITAFSFERLKLELDKCVLLCERCHIELHDNLINLDDYL